MRQLRPGVTLGKNLRTAIKKIIADPSFRRKVLLRLKAKLKL